MARRSRRKRRRETNKRKSGEPIADLDIGENEKTDEQGGADRWQGMVKFVYLVKTKSPNAGLLLIGLHLQLFELIYHSYIQWHVNERGRKTIAQGGRGRTMKWRRRKGFKGAEDRVAFASEDRRNTDANVTSWPQGAGGVDFAALPPFRPPRDRNRRHCQSQSGGGECKEEREKGEKHMADGLPYVQAYRMRQFSGTQL